MKRNIILSIFKSTYGLSIPKRQILKMKCFRFLFWITNLHLLQLGGLNAMVTDMMKKSVQEPCWSDLMVASSSFSTAARCPLVKSRQAGTLWKKTQLTTLLEFTIHSDFISWMLYFFIYGHFTDTVNISVRFPLTSSLINHIEKASETENESKLWTEKISKTWLKRAKWLEWGKRYSRERQYIQKLKRQEKGCG